MFLDSHCRSSSLPARESIVKIWSLFFKSCTQKTELFSQFSWEYGHSLVQVLPRAAFTNRVSADVFVLPLLFLSFLRMMQHCCCLPLIEMFVCDGEKRWSHQTLRAAANPAHWRFILSFHLSASPTSRMRDGTQVHSKGWLMTQEAGGGGVGGVSHAISVPMETNG